MVADGRLRQLDRPGQVAHARFAALVAWMRLSSRNRAGSATALRTAASSVASAAVIGAPVIGAQHGRPGEAVSRQGQLSTGGGGRHTPSVPRVLTTVDVRAMLSPSTVSRSPEVPMGRVQLALNVSDVDEAVAFYAELFQAEPAKRRPGYANFAIAEPPLKLVLLRVRRSPRLRRGRRAQPPRRRGRGHRRGRRGDQARWPTRGSRPATEENTTCCYATQDKVWVSDPDGAPWEVYTVIADAPAPGPLRAASVTPRAAAAPPRQRTSPPPRPAAERSTAYLPAFSTCSGPASTSTSATRAPTWRSATQPATPTAPDIERRVRSLGGPGTPGGHAW